jgi:hypothetical protein
VKDVADSQGRHLPDGAVSQAQGLIGWAATRQGEGVVDGGGAAANGRGDAGPVRRQAETSQRAGVQGRQHVGCLADPRPAGVLRAGVSMCVDEAILPDPLPALECFPLGQRGLPG